MGDTILMKGLVTISKVFKDGRRECVLNQERNVLTDGFAIGLTSIFTSTPTKELDQYHFKYFQIGTDSYYSDVIIPEVNIDNSEFAYALPYTTHNNFYELSSAITDVEDYGLDGDVEVVEREILTVTNPPFTLSENLNYTTKKVLLAKLPNHPTTKITERSVHVKITIDRESLNGVSIKEMGLFCENPENKFRPVAALAAYKSIPEAIVKTPDFALDIEWVIKLDSYTENDPYYDVWDLQRIGDTLRFYPGVSGRAAAFYTATIGDDKLYNTPGDGPGTGTGRVAKGRYIVKVESFVPTTKDGYLHYSLSGNAVSGLHYEIDYRTHSPIYVPKGTTSISIPVYNLESDNAYSNSSTYLEIHLDEFTGGKPLPEVFKDSTPDYFRLFFKNSETPPVISLGTSTVDGVAAVTASLDVSCMSPVDAYLKFDSTGDLIVKDSRDSVILSSDDPVDKGALLTIPVGEVLGYVTVSGDSGTSVEVSCYNIVEGTPETNFFSHSNDFSPEEQIPTVISIKDIVSHTEDLITTNSYWWRHTIGHGRIYHPGYPTQKTHSGNDTYSTGPTQHMYLHSYVLSGTKAPDGLQDATLSYAPSSIYIWPEVKSANKTYYENTGQARPVDSPPKIRRSYTSFEKDALGRQIDRQSQTYEFDSSTSTVVISMYVKKLEENGGTVFVNHPNFVESSQVTTSEYFQIRLFSRGFKETGDGLTPGAASKGCYATFRWNPDTDGLEVFNYGTDSESAWAIAGSTIQAGVFNGTPDDFQNFGRNDPWCKDGWHRAFIACQIPDGLTDAAPNADLNYDGLGSVSQYFIVPSCSSVVDSKKADLPGYNGSLDEAPEILSGTVHCWAQYDRILKSEFGPQRNGYVPRPYQPRAYDFFEPIGNAYVSTLEANRKVDVAF